MSAGALMNARVRTLVLGAADLKAGNTGILYTVCTDRRMNHKLEVIHGMLKTESEEMIKCFSKFCKKVGKIKINCLLVILYRLEHYKFGAYRLP